MANDGEDFCTPFVHVGIHKMGDGDRISLKTPTVEQMMAALQCVIDKDDGNYNIEFTLLGSELVGTEFHEFVVGHPALVVIAWEAKQLVLGNGDHIIVVKLVGGGHNSGFFEAPFDEKTPCRFSQWPE